ncbi:MAG: hypothetical protein GC179_25215 [Anaerolineaceae bacterium]|nr:hypothetical protein [Anaerolineaceae bacterium]
MKTYENIPTILTFNGVPVKARRGFWLVVALVWVILTAIGTWRWPGQSVLAYVLVGGVGTLVGMMVDVGHACAHTIGAKMAHAPTAVVLLGADMPRTLYPDEKMRPSQHIARSLGGPIYSWIGFGIGLLLLRVIPPQTAWRYLAEIWTFGNAFIGLAIFAPVPLVDGGVIIKWLLVIGGQDEGQADRIVHWMDIVLIVMLLIGAGVTALSDLWVAAVGLVLVAILIGLIVLEVIR